jgi:hypothetical protein
MKTLGQALAIVATCWLLLALIGAATAEAHRPYKSALRSEAYENVLDYAHENSGGITGKPFLSLYSDVKLYHNWGPHGRCAIGSVTVVGGYAHMETCWNLDTGYVKTIPRGVTNKARMAMASSVPSKRRAARTAISASLTQARLDFGFAPANQHPVVLSNKKRARFNARDVDVLLVAGVRLDSYIYRTRVYKRGHDKPYLTGSTAVPGVYRHLMQQPPGPPTPQYLDAFTMLNAMKDQARSIGVRMCYDFNNATTSDGFLSYHKFTCIGYNWETPCYIFMPGDPNRGSCVSYAIAVWEWGPNADADLNRKCRRILYFRVRMAKVPGMGRVPVLYNDLDNPGKVTGTNQKPKKHCRNYDPKTLA